MFTAYSVSLLARGLAPDGILQVRTDVPGYAELIEDVIRTSGLFGPHDNSLAACLADTIPTTREAWCYRK